METTSKYDKYLFAEDFNSKMSDYAMKDFWNLYHHRNLPHHAACLSSILIFFKQTVLNVLMTHM